MKGNWVGFITALLTFLAVAWQGYEEYQRQHPAPVVQPGVQQGPPPGATVYWQEGQQWFCKVGDQVLVWRPAQMPATHVAQHDVTLRR